MVTGIALQDYFLPADNLVIKAEKEKKNQVEPYVISIFYMEKKSKLQITFTTFKTSFL